MKPSILMKISSLLATALVLVASASAADTKMPISGDDYVEVERWTVGTEIIVRLRPKSTASAQTSPPIVPSAKTPSADSPQASKNGDAKADTKPTTTASQSGNIWANLAPEQAQSFYDTLAKEDTNSITDSPGLNALGINVSDINHPTTPKDFGVALAKGTDTSGNVKEGVALQFTPATLFFPSSIVGGMTYVNDPWMQRWARTSVELATAKSDIKSLGQQTAVSVSVGIIDKADPRLFWTDYELCARTAMEKLSQEGPPPGPMATQADMDNYSKLVDKYQKQAEACGNKVDQHWGKSRWYAGAAKGWNTGADSTKFRDLKSGPSMLWTTYAVGVQSGGTNGSDGKNDAPPIVRKQLELALSKKWNLPVADSTDASKLHNENRTDVIARVRFSRDRWNAFVDAGLSRVSTDGVLSANVRRFGYGAEYKVDDNLWLVLGSVVEHGYVSSDSKRTLLNMGLRFGQTNKEIFQAPAYDPAAPGTGSAGKANQ